jgi:hypothetical protein
MNTPLRILPALVCAFVVASSATLTAGSTWAVDASLPYFTQDHKVGVALEVGYRKERKFIGADLVWHQYTTAYGASAKLTAPGVAFRYYLPIGAPWNLEAYIGAGLGSARIKTTSRYPSPYTYSNDYLALQFALGVLMPLGKSNTKLKLGWRHLEAAHIFGAGFVGDAIESGLNWRF